MSGERERERGSNEREREREKLSEWLTGKTKAKNWLMSNYFETLFSLLVTELIYSTFSFYLIAVSF